MRTIPDPFSASFPARPARVPSRHRRSGGAVISNGSGTRRCGYTVSVSVVARQAAFRGPGGDLGARGEAELAEDVADVGLDGPLAENEGGGDLSVRLAPADERRHVALARGQPAEGLLGSLARCERRGRGNEVGRAPQKVLRAGSGPAPPAASPSTTGAPPRTRLRPPRRRPCSATEPDRERPRSARAAVARLVRSPLAGRPAAQPLPRPAARAPPAPRRAGRSGGASGGPVSRSAREAISSSASRSAVAGSPRASASRAWAYQIARSAQVCAGRVSSTNPSSSDSARAQSPCSTQASAASADEKRIQ